MLLMTCLLPESRACPQPAIWAAPGKDKYGAVPGPLEAVPLLLPSRQVLLLDKATLRKEHGFGFTSDQRAGLQHRLGPIDG